MNPRKGALWVVGGVLAVSLLVGIMSASSSRPVAAPTPAPAPRTRAAVAAAALSQLGMSDDAPYWASALPTVPTSQLAKLDWCGAFALWCLHTAGLATDVFWQLGLGFLITKQHRLPTTSSPQVGDIAYFDHNEHEAVVVGVSGTTIQLVNGNGVGGKVSRSLIQQAEATAFFSIAPLLPGGALA